MKPAPSETVIMRRDVAEDGSIVARIWQLPDDEPLPDRPPDRESYYPAEVVANAQVPDGVVSVSP